MGNTYTQIHIHAVFAVQNRLSLIQKQWEEEQEDHHKKRTFEDEYLELLKLFNVHYNEKYILKNPE
jgi:hypothetical protein